MCKITHSSENGLLTDSNRQIGTGVDNQRRDERAKGRREKMKQAEQMNDITAERAQARALIQYRRTGVQFCNSRAAS